MRLALPWVLAVAFFAPAACVLDRQGTRLFGAGGEGPQTTTAAGGGAPTTTSDGGATSSTSGDGGTGAAGGSGGGGVVVESDCLNGVDDDGDGLLDCDDDDCQGAGYTCLAPLPTALALVVIAGSVCPASTQPRALRSCDASACACAGSPGSCSFAVGRWNGNDCGGQQSSSTKTQPNCYYISGSNSAFMGNATPLGNSTCAATAPDVAAVDAGACEVLGGSCTGGATCVPPGFPAAQACVLLPAGSTCTAPYDAYAAVVYDNPSATCSCSCSKIGETCSGTITGHQGGNSCPQPATGTAAIDGQCHAVGFLHSYNIPQVVAEPQCGATASMPSGQAQLCCTNLPL